MNEINKEILILSPNLSPLEVYAKNSLTVISKDENHQTRELLTGQARNSQIPNKFSRLIQIHSSGIPINRDNNQFPNIKN